MRRARFHDDPVAHAQIKSAVFATLARANTAEPVEHMHDALDTADPALAWAARLEFMNRPGRGDNPAFGQLPGMIPVPEAAKAGGVDPQDRRDRADGRRESGGTAARPKQSDRPPHRRPRDTTALME
jgi:hypothetical protein